MPAFVRYVGIDYSGAETPTASLKGLRVYQTDGSAQPEEVLPSPSLRKYWTRRGAAEWLIEQLTGDTPTLVGIDHGFSFPKRYFETYGLQPDWPTFLDNLLRHWPTDEDNTYVQFVRDGIRGNGAVRSGNARWRRLTEERAGGANAVFHFDVQGSVAKSTHAGFPGCASSANSLARRCISGRSMAGTSLPGAPPSPRSFQRSGAAALPARTGPAISTMPTALSPGLRALTGTVALLRS